MKICLKTQLKAEVNNPNLPILEKMQQFTLDAITASGNSSMTDDQKWALNHFFYSLGKFDTGENRIWDKIEVLYLPIIAAEGNKAFICYTDFANNANSQNAEYLVLQEHGVTVGNGASESTKYNLSFRNNIQKNIRTNNVSFITMHSGLGRNIGFAITDINSNELLRMFPNPYVSGEPQNYGLRITGKDNTYCYGLELEAVSIRSINVTGWNGVDSTGLSVLGSNGNGILKATPVIRDTYYELVSYLGNRITTFFKVEECRPIQAEILSEGLSEAQASKVVTALSELRNAFVVV